MRHTQVSVHTRSGVPSFLPQLSPIAQVLACQTRHAFCCVRGELGRNGIAASAVALGTLLEMVEEGAQRSFTLNRYRKSCAAAERLPCDTPLLALRAPEFESAICDEASEIGTLAVPEQY